MTIKKLIELSEKYEDEGIEIILEFSKYGLILRGYLRRESLYSKKKNYSISELYGEHWQEKLELIVDSFKKEFLKEYDEFLCKSLRR